MDINERVKEVFDSLAVTKELTDPGTVESWNYVCIDNYFSFHRKRSGKILTCVIKNEKIKISFSYRLTEETKRNLISKFPNYSIEQRSKTFNITDKKGRTIPVTHGSNIVDYVFYLIEPEELQELLFIIDEYI